MTTPEHPPRWAADPFGRHEHRYWDGVQWTEHVADRGRNALDPPVPTPTPPAGATLAPPTLSSGASYAARAPYTPPRDPTDVLGRRYGAFFIDLAICVAAFTAFFFATSTPYTVPEALRIPGCHLSQTNRDHVDCDGRTMVNINDTVYDVEPGFALLSVLFTFFYFAVAEGLWRGSIGKQIVGLRVVDDEGQRIGVPRSMARWALFAVDGPLTLFICGIVTSAVSSGHCRLGDMAANSYVVGKDDAGRAVTVRKR